MKYTKPELEIFSVETETLIAASLPQKETESMGGFDPSGPYVDEAGTNKRQPQTNGWSQEQWTEN